MLVLATSAANKEALDILLEQGVLGAVCVLLISAVIYLVRSMQKSHKERVGDLKTYAENIKSQNTAMSGLVKEMNQASAQLSQDTILSNQEVVGGMEDMQKQVEGNTKIIESLNTQQIRLETAINVKGGLHG